ncbi:glycosyltransferase family 2 protein [Tatumella saanichensis]|uniref:glycosyltransferase family 2 protein n=1 Tax=Tatumella saanichensis TaxID=480813 RepID=UPI00056DDB1B|nr:glycosyltransferase family 2 protein [Tatumella saanichensis]
MNKENPSVAIIMPAYNSENTIRKAIDSVVLQTYKNWVLYVIDDKSTDDTLDVISEYSSYENIKIIKKVTNGGAALARNLGLEKSIEDIICFLDSDDVWHSRKLELQVKEITKGARFVISAYNYISDGKVKVNYSKANLTKDDFIKKKYRVCFSSVCFVNEEKKRKFEALGHEDFIFLVDLFDSYNSCIVLPEVLVDYYAQNGSLSSNKIVASKWHFLALSFMFTNKVKVIYLFLFYVINSFKFMRLVRKNNA